MKSRFISIISLIIIITIIFTACSLFQKRPSFLDNNTCLAPCWRGIQPGLTSGETVLNILDSGKDIQTSSIHKANINNARYPDNILWDFQDGAEGRITLNNNLVVDINITTISYRLNDLFDIYGEPEKVIVISSVGDSIEWLVYILYPKRGIVLVETNSNNSDNEINVSKNDKIIAIYYNSPNSFQALNQTLTGHKPEEDFNVESLYQPWKGFGNYKINLLSP